MRIILDENDSIKREVKDLEYAILDLNEFYEVKYFWIYLKI